jgi:tetratricopeptide (TPR) repeat protein
VQRRARLEALQARVQASRFYPSEYRTERIGALEARYRAALEEARQLQEVRRRADLERIERAQELTDAVARARSLRAYRAREAAADDIVERAVPVNTLTEELLDAPPPPLGVAPPALANRLDGISLFENAKSAFAAGRYSEAVSLANRALAQRPGDPSIQEFRALSLFSLGDYYPAAEAVHAALRVRPGWDYASMLSLYRDEANYRNQLRALEQYSARTRQSFAQFLLGYHYRLSGQVTAANAQLSAFLRQVPDDPVALELLNLGGQVVRIPVVTENGAVIATRFAVEPVAAAPFDPLVDVPPLLGTWKATADGKSVYQLTLSANNEFLWRYPNDSKEPLRGVYASDGNRIIFETDRGVVMTGMIAAAPEGLGLRVTGPGGAYLQFLK